MKLEITVPEVLSIFKEIKQKPERIFEIIRSEVNESVGEYLTKLMQVELTSFLGREKYEHGAGDVNYRNGSYGRKFTLKRIGEIDVEIPRDRQGKYKTQVIPRSKRYEEEIRQDLSFMFSVLPPFISDQMSNNPIGIRSSRNESLLSILRT